MFCVLPRVIRGRVLQIVHCSFSSKIPEKPAWEYVDYNNLPEVPEINLSLIEQLERISLVEFNNEEGVKRLQAAVQSAGLLHKVDTDGIEPLDSVLEGRELWLREDVVTDGNCLKDILSNASKVEEDYFVAPPGNIPIKKRDMQHLNDVLRGKSDEANS